MASKADAARTLARLYDARDAAQAVFGAHYAEHVAVAASLIRAVMRRTGEERLDVAIREAHAAERRGEKFAALAILAAFVEMAEDSPLVAAPVSEVPA